MIVVTAKPFDRYDITVGFKPQGRPDKYFDVLKMNKIE